MDQKVKTHAERLKDKEAITFQKKLIIQPNLDEIMDALEQDIDCTGKGPICGEVILIPPMEGDCTMKVREALIHTANMKHRIQEMQQAVENTQRLIVYTVNKYKEQLEDED